VAIAVGEDVMKTLLTLTSLLLFAVFLAPKASASYDYSAEDIQQLVIAEAKRQNLAPSLALAIAKVESNFDPKALSHAGAKGVMQIMPRTAEQTFGVPRGRLFEPRVNINLGVRFIKQLLERYDNHLEIALSHYNGGSRVKNRQGEFRVMPTTRSYVNKVLDTQQGFLHYDNHNQFFLSQHQSDIDSLYVDTSITQTHSQLFDTRSQNPQVETLRALRMHNISRNFQGKADIYFNHKPALLKKQPLRQVSLKSKISKVRQWESIYVF
jgi:hypothetical protein